MIDNFAFDTLPLKCLEDTFPVGCWVGGCWVAGLSGTKTKLNSSLSWSWVGAELGNKSNIINGIDYNNLYK